MRILITGASGLVGLNLALAAAEGQAGGKRHTVTGVVSRRRLATEAFRVVAADLTAPGAVERLLETTGPDWVINCAALANLDQCEAEPELAHKVNVDLPAELAKYVARGGARLLHLSTDSVFDGTKGDYTEEDEPNPLGVYSRTKLEGERAVAEADPTAIIARVNVFGWSLSGSRSLAEFFYYNLAAGKRVNGFTDVVFCPLHTGDLARILLCMLDKRLSGLYHAVSRECLSKHEFGVRIARAFGLDESLITPIPVEDAGLAAPRARNLSLRSEKLASALGTPVPGVAEGIAKLKREFEAGYAAKIMRLGDRGLGTGDQGPGD